MKSYILKLILCFLLLSGLCKAAQKTWTGGSTDWHTGSNWSPSGVPSNTDTVSIGSTSNNPLVASDDTIGRLTISSGTLDLGGYTLTVSTRISATGGTVTNGKLIIRGSAATFDGTIFNCKIDAISSVLKLDGGVFNDSCYFEHSGSASSGNGQGGNVFNGYVKIRNSGNISLQLGVAAPDTFNANVCLYNSGSVNITTSYNYDTYINGNLEIANDGTGTINFGRQAGSSYTRLASGKSFTVGSNGFSSGSTGLSRFIQLGNQAISLSFSGSTAVFNSYASEFNGNLTISAPTILFKNSTFNGIVEVTKTANTGNQSEGGNIFNDDLIVNSTVASSTFRMSTQSGDEYNGDVTLNSSNAFIQLCYSDTSEFKGNIDIDHTRVAFNVGSGAMMFSGSNSQVLSGVVPFAIGKLYISKSGGSVTVNQPVNLDSALTFIDGVIYTDSINYLTLKKAVISTGGCDSSYVDGYVKKIGNSAFEFPLGSNNLYYPTLITAPISATDAYLCSYLSLGQTESDSVDTTLSYLSNCRNWNLTRTSGSSKVKVALFWQNPHENDCELIHPNYLKVANWNGTKWIDEGGFNYTGDMESGYLWSIDSLTSLGRFTIGSSIQPYYLQRNCLLTAGTAGTTCNNSTSVAYDTRYSHPSENIPSPTQEVKVIRVNLNIVYDPNDLGANFDPNNSVDLGHISTILGWLEAGYSACTTPFVGPTRQGMPSTPLPLTDTRIRFDIQVYWYSDPIMAYNTSATDHLANIASIDIERMKAVNCIIIPASSPGNYWGHASLPVLFNETANAFTLSFDVFREGLVTSFYSVAKHLEHEIGHTLGLLHNYLPLGSTSTCVTTDKDFLWDIFGLSPSNCLFPVVGTSNDIMGGGDTEHISPKQMGIMHRSLSFTNMRRFVSNCITTVDNSEIVVSSDETWDFDFKCYKNIRIEPGNTLTLTCKLIMEDNSKIIVERGAKLIVDGAQIYSECNMWKGIELWGNSGLSQYPYATSAQGVVEFKNGAIIKDALDVVKTIKIDPFTGLEDPLFAGGIIRADNSTFDRNRTVFNFYPYDNFIPSNPSVKLNNFSSITNCNFQTTYNLYDISKRPKEFIKMFSVDGIRIQGNSFSNTQNPLGIYNERDRGNGIVSIDSRFIVMPYSSTRNTFEGLFYGISSVNTNGFKSAIILDTDFEDCYRAINIENCNNLKIKGCEIQVRSRGDVPNTSDETYGVRLNSCYNYSFENNSLESMVLNEADNGLIISNCGDDLNRPYNNSFTGFTTSGLLSIDDNDGPLNNDGLIINCNDFADQYLYDIFVTNLGSVSFGIGDHQGDCISSASTARNQFSSENICSGPGYNLAITSGGTNPFTYYASPGQSSSAEIQCYTNNVFHMLCNLDFDKESDCPDLSMNPTQLSEARELAYEQIVGFESRLDFVSSDAIEYEIFSNMIDNEEIDAIAAFSPYIDSQILLSILNNLQNLYDNGIDTANVFNLFRENSPLSLGNLNYLRTLINKSSIYEELYNNIEPYQESINDARELLDSLEYHRVFYNYYNSKLLTELTVTEDSVEIGNYSEDALSIVHSAKGYSKLNLHDYYVTYSKFSEAIACLDSLYEPELIGLHSEILAIMDSIKSNNYLNLRSSSLASYLYEFKDDNSRLGSISRSILTITNDSVFEPPTIESYSMERLAQQEVENVKTDELIIYPNPVGDILNVNLFGHSSETVQFSIFNALGQLVLQDNIELDSRSKFSVGLATLPSGIYVIALSGTDLNKRGKFCKE